MDRATSALPSCITPPLARQAPCPPEQWMHQAPEDRLLIEAGDGAVVSQFQFSSEEKNDEIPFWQVTILGMDCKSSKF